MVKLGFEASAPEYTGRAGRYGICTLHLLLVILINVCVELWLEQSYILLWFLVTSLSSVFLLRGRGRKVRTCSASYYPRLSSESIKIPILDK